MEEAEELGTEALSINGGEPLLMEYVGDIVAEAVKRSITPVLMTNGLLLPEKWEMLTEKGLRYIILSFDSLDPGVYEKQRGVPFAAGMAGVKSALDMKRRYPDAQIHVTSVLTRQNMEETPEFIRRMSDMGIFVQLSPYHHFNPLKKDELSIRNEDETRRLTYTLLQMKSDGYRIANSAGFLAHIPAFFVEGKRVPDDYECLIGYTNLFIDAHMNARPCWASCFESVGNIGT